MLLRSLKFYPFEDVPSGLPIYPLHSFPTFENVFCWYLVYTKEIEDLHCMAAQQSCVLEIATRTCEFSALLNNFNFGDNPAPLFMLLWMIPSHKIGFAFTDHFHFVLPSFIQDFPKILKHSSCIYIATMQFQWRVQFQT